MKMNKQNVLDGWSCCQTPALFGKRGSMSEHSAVDKAQSCFVAPKFLILQFI